MQAVKGEMQERKKPTPQGRLLCMSELKAANHVFELDGLLFHRLRGGRHLFHQRRILLRGAIELVDGDIDLGNPATLFIA